MPRIAECDWLTLCWRNADYSKTKNACIKEIVFAGLGLMLRSNWETSNLSKNWILAKQPQCLLSPQRLHIAERQPRRLWTPVFSLIRPGIEPEFTNLTTDAYLLMIHLYALLGLGSFLLLTKTFLFSFLDLTVLTSHFRVTILIGLSKTFLCWKTNCPCRWHCLNRLRFLCYCQMSPASELLKLERSRLTGSGPYQKYHWSGDAHVITIQLRILKFFFLKMFKMRSSFSKW